MSQTSLIGAETAATTGFAAEAAAAPASIVSRAVLHAPDARVTWFSFAAGQELSTHTNRRRALIQVLTGTGEFMFNGQWQQVAAGGWIHFPPNHPHAVRAAEPFTMLLTLTGEAAA